MKTKTNIEKVTDAMNFGSPLNQVVVLTALDKYCQKVADCKEKPENWGNMICWDSWKESCKDIAERIEL
tara:strand:- start:1387 stop:1593 length:207 start_codon:yes stop_codon:yes gene_type:complete